MRLCLRASDTSAFSPKEKVTKSDPACQLERRLLIKGKGTLMSPSKPHTGQLALDRCVLLPHQADHESTTGNCDSFGCRPNEPRRHSTCPLLSLLSNLICGHFNGKSQFSMRKRGYIGGVLFLPDCSPWHWPHKQTNTETGRERERGAFNSVPSLSSSSLFCTSTKPNQSISSND